MPIVERPVPPSMPGTGVTGPFGPDNSLCSWPGFWHCLVPLSS